MLECKAVAMIRAIWTCVFFKNENMSRKIIFSAGLYGFKEFLWSMKVFEYV
jgi:hypothetical protein